MTARRQELQTLLEGILGSNKVYFQPPPKVKLEYPCIIYHLSDIQTIHANNSPYLRTKSYQVKVVDQDPDSTIPDSIGELPLCSFDRRYTTSYLNHFVFNLYF